MIVAGVLFPNLELFAVELGIILWRFGGGLETLLRATDRGRKRVYMLG